MKRKILSCLVLLAMIVPGSLPVQVTAVVNDGEKTLPSQGSTLTSSNTLESGLLESVSSQESSTETTTTTTASSASETEQSSTSPSVEETTTEATTVNSTEESVEKAAPAPEQSQKQTEVPKKAQTSDIKPVAGEVTVGNWADFVAAIKNETVTKIILSASFENPKSSDVSLSTYVRKNDLEIDGRGNRVNFKDSSIYLGKPTNSTGQFHMHDIVLNQTYGGGYSEDIVGTRLLYTNAGKWKYRFGNITAESGVQRLARASYAEVTVYGKMDLDTRAENFYLGSFIMEDNTVYKGNVNHYNFSIFWYNVKTPSGATGESMEYTIGKNCQVTLTQSQTSGTTYPAVFSYYQGITIGEGSAFNVNMPGNAVRFDEKGAGMTIKKGAVVNLTSKQDSGSVVAFSTNDTYLTAEPGSYFYVIGHSSQPLIDLGANATGTGTVYRTGNTFTLNSPAQYDLRNLKDGETAVNLNSLNYADNEFSIIDSDIDLWETTSEAMGPSDETYSQVPDFKVTGHGTKEIVTTSVAGLQQFKQASYRRISGMNQKPELEWEPVTDADKTLKARVIIGYVPDNEGSASGTVNYIPVYASENQAQVDVTDSYGTIKSAVPTDREGYITVTDTKFQKTGGTVQGLAKRSAWIADAPDATAVLDVTPPDPAQVTDADKIFTKTKTLSGTGEPNSLLLLKLNDGDSGIAPITVAADGTWSEDISSLTLQKDDVLQLFLEDQSGKVSAELPDPPSTNNSVGNIEPATDQKYHDATFKAATKITVLEDPGELALVSVPTLFDFGTNKVSQSKTEFRPTVTGDLVVSDTRGTDKKPWQLKVHQSVEWASAKNSLANNLYYTSASGDHQITAAPQIVETGELTADGTENLSANWGTKYGLKLVVPIEKQIAGDYQGELSWSLEDVPAP